VAKWTKKLNIVKFNEQVICPFCPDTFPTNLSLCRHVLNKHNWNEDFLKGFEIIEVHSGWMIAKKKGEG